MKVDLRTVVAEFRQNGFAVIDDFLSPEEVESARKEMGRIVEEMDPTDHPVNVFFADDKNSRHVKDDYFLTSSDKIRFFYEDGAVDKNGDLLVDKSKAFNKVGHALHYLNPVFREISFSDKVKNVFSTVGYKKPAIVQSMYIFKPPHIGGVVTSHFDATFLYVEPIENLIGVWIPIDDATVENGCLWFIPGSHKTHNAQFRFVRTHKTDGSPRLEFTGEKPQTDDSKFVPVPVRKGSCVLIHGLVIHKSEANKSDKPRNAYTFHVVETKNTAWSPDNWLQQTNDYTFPILYDDDGYKA